MRWIKYLNAKSSYNNFMAKYKFNSIRGTLFTIIVILPLGLAISYFPMLFLTNFLENNFIFLVYIIFFGIIAYIIIKIIIDNTRDKQKKEYESSPFYKECLTTYDVFKRIDKIHLTQSFIFSFLKVELKSKIQIYRGSNNKAIFIVFHTSGIYFCNFTPINLIVNNFQLYNYLRSPKGLSELKLKTFKVTFDELKKYTISKALIEETTQTLNQISILNFSNYLKSQNSNIYSIDQNTMNYQLYEEYIDSLNYKIVNQGSRIILNKATKNLVSKSPDIDLENIELAKQQLNEIIEKGNIKKNK